jgi:hypothetical protein
MKFEGAFNDWLDHHRSLRKGRRLEQIRKGLPYSEEMFARNVWWPAFHHFEYLHPQYEVRDFKDGVRYIDAAYIRPPLKLAIEVDDFTTHCREMDPNDFSDERRRQNHIIIDGWSILRFSYHDVRDRPRVCQQEIQQLLGRWIGEEHPIQTKDVIDKEAYRFCCRLGRAVRPRDLAEHMNIGPKYARRILHELVKQGRLVPASGSDRIRSFTLKSDRAFPLE